MTSPSRHDFSASDSPAGTPSQSRARLPPPYTASASPASVGLGTSHFQPYIGRSPIFNQTGVSPPGAAEGDGLESVDMDEGSGHGMASVPARFWGSNQSSSSLPSFSRAFGMFMPSESEPAIGSDDHFFVPSYLADSTYVQMLGEAHNRKVLREREMQSSTASALSGATNGARNNLPPGSHRGMAHTVIERSSPYEEDEVLAPLPTGWDKDDSSEGLDLQADGLSIKHVGNKPYPERETLAAAIRANHHMPPQCGIYYFEVQMLAGRREDLTVAVGFSSKNAALTRPVGWEPESWGYHGDDGRCFASHSTGRQYGPTYNTGDTIGCGVNFRENTIFFTRNGKKLGDAFHDVSKGRLYPTISLKQPGEFVRANFGQTPFVFNIDDVMKEQRAKIQDQIDSTPVTDLEPGLSQADLIQTLVLQFLQHDGYVETARAFAEEIKTQKETLNLDPNEQVAGVNIKDDEDANNRQRIRRAVLEGDIDRALKLTNAYYPQVLQEHEDVNFRLRCRRFIELVRQAALMRMSGDVKKSNGHGAEMDVDTNGTENGWAESVQTETSGELRELEEAMLEYGQRLHAEYLHDSRHSDALGEIWALVAYQNPLKEPHVSHLLDPKGRVKAAEELNSAILLSLGKSSRAALETMYAQTKVLLEDIRSDGGDACFVSVEDAFNDIPTPIDEL